MNIDLIDTEMTMYDDCYTPEPIQPKDSEWTDYVLNVNTHNVINNIELFNILENVLNVNRNKFKHFMFNFRFTEEGFYKIIDNLIENIGGRKYSNTEYMAVKDYLRQLKIDYFVEKSGIKNITTDKITNELITTTEKILLHNNKPIDMGSYDFFITIKYLIELENAITIDDEISSLYK